MWKLRKPLCYYFVIIFLEKVVRTYIESEICVEFLPFSGINAYDTDDIPNDNFLRGSGEGEEAKWLVEKNQPVPVVM